MRNAKFAWISNYLSEAFPDGKIEQKYDFDLSAQRFKVTLPKTSLLLKVTDTFVEDNDLANIAKQFGKWEVARMLSTNAAQTILVTNDGLKTRTRF